MESRAIEIPAPMNKKIALKVIPGHFATNNSHINLYIDLTTMKTRQKEAEEAAKVIAEQYKSNAVVDTIVCLEGCEVIGAFLAQELSNAGIHSMNAHQTIYIITPAFNTNGQMTFRVNNQPAVYGKHILLLAGSVTTGDTLKKAMECIRYYGGIAAGIAAVFSALDTIDDMQVNSIFQPKHLPEYKSYAIDECPLCKAKQRLEAIVDGYGYVKL
ncbi:MAG: phosphoribosyltransferase [Lachnospiraceae bacterium]|jgi:orotate phosphoribosyltransferase|nr:phosphoribosyltransferase [Lachnospiraceae bacterium]